MSEVAMLTELRELTDQKSPNQNKQRALVRQHGLTQADRADIGGVGSVTKSNIQIHAEAYRAISKMDIDAAFGNLEVNIQCQLTAARLSFSVRLPTSDFLD